MTGNLILIPTPLDDDLMLDSYALSYLQNAQKNLEDNLFYIEDHKPARRRWISWGLDRDVINHFIQFNEHTMNERLESSVNSLKSGKNIFLMSDGGLPSFCDPGSRLVRRCHELGIKVSCSPHHNSISQSVALSGFDCNEFHFYGFPPRKSDQRALFLNKIVKNNFTSILMDTPYRLRKILEELKDIGVKRTIFLATNLNSSNERLYFGSVSKVMKSLESDKAEFILIIE